MNFTGFQLPDLNDFLNFSNTDLQWQWATYSKKITAKSFHANKKLKRSEDLLVEKKQVIIPWTLCLGRIDVIINPVILSAKCKKKIVTIKINVYGCDKL